MSRSASGWLLPLAFVAAVLMSGCADDATPLNRLDPDAVILAFGDSLTYGTGVGQDHSYPAVLARLTGRQVINAGVPGEVSQTGVARLPELLDRYHPHLLLLCHGANDLLRKRNKEEMAENLRTMVRLARARGIDVVLIGVPMPRLALRKTDPVYDAIAREFGLPYEGAILAELESEPSLKSDQVHFNNAGYKRMAQAVYALLGEYDAL